MFYMCYYRYLVYNILAILLSTDLIKLLKSSSLMSIVLSVSYR